jgi:hypothetical protein
MGNDLHQAATTENNNVIGYGPEGCPDRTGKQMSLYVVHNTLVNEARQGTLVRNFAGGDVTVANNLLFGRGSFLAGDGIEVSNFQESLNQWTGDSWESPFESDAIDSAISMPSVMGVSITPRRQAPGLQGQTVRVVESRPGIKKAAKKRPFL